MNKAAIFRKNILITKGEYLKNYKIAFLTVKFSSFIKKKSGGVVAFIFKTRLFTLQCVPSLKEQIKLHSIIFSKGKY